MIYRLTVKDRVISHPFGDDVIQNGIESDSVSVSLDAEWAGKSTYIAVFANGDDAVRVSFTYAQTVDLTVPWEALQNPGSMYVTLVAYGSDGSRIVTRMMQRPFRVACSGRIVGSDEKDPTPDVVQSLVKALEESAASADSAATNANSAASSANTAAAAANAAASKANSAASSADAAATAANSSASKATASATAADQSTDAASAAAADARLAAEEARGSISPERRIYLTYETVGDTEYLTLIDTEED